MTRAEALQEIIAVVKPRNPIDEHTVIAECDDLDSLGLFNVMLFINSLGQFPELETLETLSQLSTVGDLLDLIPQD